MKILVTGGAGFVGSHLCDKLIEGGNRVWCVDNFATGNRENVKHLVNLDNFVLIEADVSQPVENYLSHGEEFDQIYHLASPASPKDFERLAVEIYQVNVWGAHHLAQKAAKDGARFLFASTSEVYGNPLEHPQKEEYRGNVNIRGPRSCYDESKRMGETVQVVWAQKAEVDIRTVRIFNTYGPRMRRDDGRVIPSFISQAVAGKPVTVFGDGSQTRSYCYVDDLVAGLIRVMNEEAARDEVYNLGNDEELTILETAKKIIEVTGSDSEIVFGELPEDDPTRRRPDLGKIKAELAWEPVVQFGVGLEKTIDYFRKA